MKDKTLIMILLSFTLFCIIYYTIIFLYSKHLKNKYLFKNTKVKHVSLKNSYTFENNYEDSPSYKSKVIPVDVVKSVRDWKSDLNAINHQQDFVEDTNTIGGYINDTDLEHPNLN